MSGREESDRAAAAFRKGFASWWESLSPDEQQAWRERWKRKKAETLAFWRSYRDVMNAVWVREYGEPFPMDLDEWRRQAARAGVSADYLLGADWTPAKVAPLIEGYLLKLRDARDDGPDDIVDQKEIARRYDYTGSKQVYRWRMEASNWFPPPIAPDEKPLRWRWQAVRKAVAEKKKKPPIPGY